MSDTGPIFGAIKIRWTRSLPSGCSQPEQKTWKPSVLTEGRTRAEGALGEEGALGAEIGGLSLHGRVREDDTRQRRQGQEARRHAPESGSLPNGLSCLLSSAWGCPRPLSCGISANTQWSFEPSGLGVA